MASISIISGCPGSGKSTLSKHLANQSPQGVCIETDTFYRFLAHRLDPSTPASKSQNTAVVRAFLRASRSYFEDGYDVVLDGVLGPWWLELIRLELSEFEYAILHADLETVLQRTSERARTSQASADPTLVRTMHGQFDALSGMEKCTINTAGKTAPEVLAEYSLRQRDGDFYP